MNDLTGKRFGRLLVLKRGTRPGGKGRRTFWLCRCDCGVEKDVWAYSLTRPTAPSRSCGCLRDDIREAALAAQGFVTQGNPTYSSWARMRMRCHNPKSTQYRWYGGRGIKVCQRWDSFHNFLADMGTRPSQKHTLDRINGDGDYEPENCRWSTQKEQMNNTRRTKHLTVDENTKTVTDWSESGEISSSLIHNRLRKGWTVKEAITRPRAVTPTYEWRGRRLTLAQWAEETGIPKSTLFCRIYAGWSLSRSFTEPLREWGPGRKKRP